MTPIVLTENGEDEEGATAAMSPPAADASVTGDTTAAAARPSGLSDDGETGLLLVSPTDEAQDDPGAKGPSAVDGGGLAVATDASTCCANKKSVAERGVTGDRGNRLGGSAEVTFPPANTRASPQEQRVTNYKATAVGEPLAPAKVATAGHGAAKTLSANQTVRGEIKLPAEKMAAGPARAATQVASPGQHARRTAVRPTAEQLFMEDTQVYLGCAACGVKYLVEAVDPDPESSKSTKGERSR